MARLQLALDIGGTFTDVVMIDGESGALWTAKTPSTPRDPSDGFFDGVEKILRLADTAPAAVATVFHGSTIATNAVLEGKGARTGMLVTAGFRYVLEIGRHEIPRKERTAKGVLAQSVHPFAMLVASDVSRRSYGLVP